MKKSLNDPVFNKISKVVDDKGVHAFVIGGYVRDLFLERESKDVDILVIGSGIEVAREVAEKLEVKNVSYYKNFGTAMFKYKGLEFEFVGARKESYRRESRKPIVENGTLEDDQQRRDFTINALAICINKENFGKVLDPFNGIDDLRKGIIRTPREPLQTFSDDPLRMMRAIRFASQLQFKIFDETLKGIKQNAERIDIISRERIVEEMHKVLLSPKPSSGLELLSSTGLLKRFLPEVEGMKGVDIKNEKAHKDNFYHTLEVVDNLRKKTDNLWLLWTGLLHDIGKPKTKKFDEEHGWTFHAHEFVGARMIKPLFRRLRLPMNEKMRYVEKLVSLHLRPIALVSEEVSDSAVRRLLFDAGDDIEDLMLLCEADVTSKNEYKIKRFLQNFQRVREKMKEIEEKDRIRNFQPPVSGEEIMETFNLKPSREVGIIKDAIKDAILDGVISNNYEEAREFMLKKGRELGLEPE
jgi:poly(A) polymerase